MNGWMDGSVRRASSRRDAAMRWFPAVARVDAFARAAPHLTKRTRAGACVSVVGVVLACALALVEISDFLTPTRAKTHGVDDARNATLRIEIDVTFPRMPCQLLYVDAYDESGKHEVDARGLLLKTRLDASGRAIGEYESAGGVDLGGLVLFQRRPEHAHEVREAKADMEGCRLHGELEARRVAGTLRASTGPESYEFLKEIYDEPWEIDMRHAVKTFTFGAEFPGAVNPMNGVRRMETKSGIYKYFMKVVPTTYSSTRALFGFIPWTVRTRTNQYSVTEHFIETPHWGALPQLFFIYDLSAIAVNITVTSKSIVYFLTKTLATMGGIFALTRTVDRYIDVALRVTSSHAKAK